MSHTAFDTLGRRLPHSANRFTNNGLLALLAAVTLAACTSGISTGEASATPVVSASHAKPTYTVIDPRHVTEQYPTLPEPVKTAALAANRDEVLRNLVDANNKASVIEAGNGSGGFIRFGKDIIELTAAHVDAATGMQCRSVYIQSPNTAGQGPQSYQVIKQTPVEKEPPNYTSAYNGGHDAAVQLFDTSSFASYALPESALFEELPTLQPGDILFTSNYQPGNGGDRDPTGRKGDPRPAIYGMTVIGKNGNDIVALDGYGPSYGSYTDNKTKGGASGGIVLTPKGGIYGVVAGIGQESSSEIKKNYGVVVPKNSDDQLVEIAPVTHDLIKRDLAAAQASAICTEAPPLH